MLRDPVSFVGWLVLVAFVSNEPVAHQMRDFDPIPTPQRTLADLPDDAQITDVLKAVPRDAVADATEALTEAWNGPDLAGMIDEDKFDKSRFDRAMITEVPRDARLEIESLRSVQTLNQAIAPDGDGGFVRISTVAATASTRLIVNDPSAGFVNAPGLNELRFRVTEKLAVEP